MPNHRMSIYVKDGCLIVICGCGQWERRQSLDDVELPSELMRLLEGEYQQHVAMACGEG